MFNSITDAERRLGALLMDDLPLESAAAVPKALPSDWYAKFKSERKKFMTSLDDSIRELAFLNLEQDEFMSLLMGQRIPENLCIKFKRPILYGGEVAAENMFMMPLFPQGMNLNLFMAEQIGQGDIYYPNPEKKIYVSASQLNGGDGGNGTADRLAQGFAAAARAGRDG